MKKVNDCMNNVAQASAGSESSGRGAGAGNVQLDHNAIMQMLGYGEQNGRKEIRTRTVDLGHRT